MFFILRITVQIIQKMQLKRFLFHIPSRNLYRPILAFSKIDALHLLMNSDLAPYYGQAVLLTPCD